jgi:glycine/D-amino acid oxidase-like deaminating enzyme
MAITSTPTCQPPVADATTPFWRTELHDLDSFRSTAELPQECDVIVVGSGFAGVSTAYHLLQNNDLPPSIVMLEARGACSGASARNGKNDPFILDSYLNQYSNLGGHVKPDVYYNILKYTRKYGAEAAASFARFESANVIAIKQLVEKERIDCDFVLTRAVDAYLDAEHAKATEDAYRELVRIGVADLGDVQLVHGENAEKVRSLSASAEGPLLMP